MMTPLAIDKVLTDSRLLGAALGDIGSWSAWLTTLRAAFGLKLDDAERATFAAISGGRVLPLKRVRELWCIAGRRAGKSRMAAALAVYFALFVKHKLVAGERGMVLVLAATIEQAKVVFNYVAAFLAASEVLQKEIASTTRSEIRLKNGIVIAVHPNSFRSVRGRTLCACVFDEVAFWRDDVSAVPDTETYTAVLPSLLTTGGMLVGIGSPYRRMGLLHAKHKKHFGVDGDDVLVVQGSSKQFNGTLDDAAIAAQREADPAAAGSEWDAQFRDDIAGFLDDALIEQAVDRGRPLELPPRAGVYYRAYVDASGGAVGGDAYCIAIAHREAGSQYVIDVVRGRAGPFDPEELTREYAGLCKEYRVTGVVGDKYAREWVSSAWRKCGVVYTAALLTASETYCECLPLWTRAAVRIPDHPVLLRELRLLERIPTRLGKDQVVHPRGVHDDFANVVFGSLYGLASHLGAYADLLAKATRWDDEPAAELSYQQQEAERRHRELMARYGQPVVLNPIPPEYLAERELLPFQREAIARARADAAARRNDSSQGDDVP
jgi:hypothetical protein